MMTKNYVFFLITALVLLLSSCSSVDLPVKNNYQLTGYSTKNRAKNRQPLTLLVTAPESAAAFQTNQMLYIKKTFELQAFAKNAWVNPPAEMLYPLILQSMQKSNLFAAITSNAYAQGADYRLDTQLLALDQNFLKKPSVLEFSVKVVLTQVRDNKALASQIIKLEVPCPADTPYGGVIAANKATYQFTEILTHFVLTHIVSFS